MKTAPFRLEETDETEEAPSQRRQLECAVKFLADRGADDELVDAVAIAIDDQRINKELATAARARQTHERNCIANFSLCTDKVAGQPDAHNHRTLP